MSDHTGIEWTDASWPIHAGCKEISAGCANCYAARLTATRLKGTEKYRGLAVIGANGHPHFTGETRMYGDHLKWPLKWRKPRKIFVDDMSDLFYEGHSDEDIDRVFGVMWACLYLGPRDAEYDGHVFQVLTKRAARMRDYLSSDRRRRWAEHAVRFGGGEDPDGLFDQTAGWQGPHPRIWVGVSCEDQRAANERVLELVATPAAVRFVSAEPLLGPIDFTRIAVSRSPHNALTGEHLTESAHAVDWSRLDWIIVGGESGPRARRCNVAWIRSIVEQCRATGTPCFVKQMGAQPRAAHDEHEAEDLRWTGPMSATRGAHGDPHQWPEDLRVREFPTGTR